MSYPEYEYPQRQYFSEVEVERKESAGVGACLGDQLTIRGALQQKVAHMHCVVTAQAQKVDSFG
jgi:hypothetical protein